jgi:bacterioferritin-associated ferredoxin
VSESATRTQEAAEASQTLDAELCFCAHVSRAAFLEAVWRAPDASFDALCRQTGVGMVCTSCLLNAEDSYVHAATHRPAVAPKNQARSAGAGLGLKRRLYRALDALSPSVPIRLGGIAPLFAGEGVRTVVTVANSVPEAVGRRSSTFSVRMVCRDSAGRVVAKHRARLEPGVRLDIDASEGLPLSGEALVTGAAFLRILAEAPGYRGTIRPHFLIIGPRSLSAVHTQGNGKREGGFHSVIGPGERQYLSLVNCAAREIGATVASGVPGQPTRTERVTIGAYGAALVRVGKGLAAREAAPLAVRFSADAPVRPHAIVAGGSPPRLSADHL